MSGRIRLIDFRNSNAAQNIGLCYGDVGRIGREVTEAQRRLIACKEAGDEGWFGSWAEIAFTLTQTAPYYTAPRNIARLEKVDLCNRPIPLYNQFTEYLRFGNGRMPKQFPWCRWAYRAAYTRNSVPTWTDLSPAPQLIAAIASDITDIESNARVFLQGLDNNGVALYSQDSGVRVDGIFMTLQSPMVISPLQLSLITGIQKDVTNGPVQFVQLDPTSGAQVTLLTMDANETTANYRRYYFDNLPFSCCPQPVSGSSSSSTPTPVTITALAKMEPLPLQVDTDYFTLMGEGVIEAISDECQSVRYSRMDSTSAKEMAAERHKSAVQILQGILYHYLGKNDPAVQFKPFGSASLRRVKVGMQ